MIKLKNLLTSFKKTSTIDECVIAKLSVGGKSILAKNRDRGYQAQVEVIHELLDGVEVVYLHDKLTDWSEGLNEFGIGIANSSLSVAFDEKEGDLAKDKLDKGKAPKISHDGLKIRIALTKKKLSEAIQSITSFVGKDSKEVGIKGHTIVANAKYSFVVELTSKHLPVITRIHEEDVVVRTNHGVQYPTTGYTSGVKRDSSISRLTIAKEKLRQAKLPSEVLDLLSDTHTQDPFMNPYRSDNKFNMHTTTQTMFNLTDLEFHMRWDKDHAKPGNYINNLPKNYEPKIRVFVGQNN